MDGAPHETLGGLLGTQTTQAHPQAGRRRKTARTPVERPQSELSWAVGVTELSPSREAAVAFVAALRALRWSEPSLTRLTTVLAETLEQQVERHRARRVRRHEGVGRERIPNPHRRHQGARTLRRRNALTPARGALGAEGRPRLCLPRRATSALRRRSSWNVHVQAAEAQQSAKKHGRRTHRPAVAGRTRAADPGRTRSDRKTAQGRGRDRARPDAHPHQVQGVRGTPQAEPGPLGATECVHPIGVWEPFGRGKSSEEFEFPVGPVEGCLSASHPARGCLGSTIGLELRTVPAARRVRLTLSNGRQVTSKVFRIPRKLGGPGGVYYQALKGPSPTPVKLEELGARGRVLRTFTLAHASRCPAPRSEETRSPDAHARQRQAAGGDAVQHPRDLDQGTRKHTNVRPPGRSGQRTFQPPHPARGRRRSLRLGARSAHVRHELETAAGRANSRSSTASCARPGTWCWPAPRAAWWRLRT